MGEERFEVKGNDFLYVAPMGSDFGVFDNPVLRTFQNCVLLPLCEEEF